LLTLVVGTELFAVLGAAVLVGVTARDGWSGPLVALFAAGLMAVGLVSRRGRRLLGRRWWLSLAGRGAAGGVAMVAFLGFTACLGIALSLTCLTPSAELRSDTLMLSVVAVLGSSVAALSASLARH
jgi:FtsH-binding integral membrane protein